MTGENGSTPGPTGSSGTSGGGGANGGDPSPLDALFSMASKTFEGLKAKSGKENHGLGCLFVIFVSSIIIHFQVKFVSQSLFIFFIIQFDSIIEKLLQKHFSLLLFSLIMKSSVKLSEV